MRPAIVVAGSLNMDFLVSVRQLPAPGETVLGRDFQMVPGGKGANQACAAGRLGGEAADVRMIGRVGYDLFADHLRASLSAAGVDVSGVISTRSQPTGVALITVDRSGQNCIVVASGANHALAAEEAEGFRDKLRGAAYALFQLESPLAFVEAAIAVAKREGAQVMLDPAPAQPLSPELHTQVDVLTPNETEAQILLGAAPSRVEVSDAAGLAARVLALGAAAVVLKLGDRGCLYQSATEEVYAPAFRVEAADATAAGDTFNAAFAVALAGGRPVTEALRFANAAAAISVTRMGAQASIPSRKEVEAFLAAASTATTARS